MTLREYLEQTYTLLDVAYACMDPSNRHRFAPEIEAHLAFTVALLRPTVRCTACARRYLVRPVVVGESDAGLFATYGSDKLWCKHCGAAVEDTEAHA